MDYTYLFGKSNQNAWMDKSLLLATISSANRLKIANLSYL